MLAIGLCQRLQTSLSHDSERQSCCRRMMPTWVEALLQVLKAKSIDGSEVSGETPAQHSTTVLCFAGEFSTGRLCLGGIRAPQVANEDIRVITSPAPMKRAIDRASGSALPVLLPLKRMHTCFLREGFGFAAEFIQKDDSTQWRRFLAACTTTGQTYVHCNYMVRRKLVN